MAVMKLLYNNTFTTAMVKVRNKSPLQTWKTVDCNVTKMVFFLNAKVQFSKVYESRKLGFVVPLKQTKAYVHERPTMH
jgi:hypothetical protein